jgi:hypothetical protein
MKNIPAWSVPRGITSHLSFKTATRAARPARPVMTLEIANPAKRIIFSTQSIKLVLSVMRIVRPVPAAGRIVRPATMGSFWSLSYLRFSVLACGVINATLAVRAALLIRVGVKIVSKGICLTSALIPVDSAIPNVRIVQGQ